jgi:hypothetical protein
MIATDVVCSLAKTCTLSNFNPTKSGTYLFAPVQDAFRITVFAAGCGEHLGSQYPVHLATLARALCVAGPQIATDRVHHLASIGELTINPLVLLFGWALTIID